MVEIGPTIQIEPSCNLADDCMWEYFKDPNSVIMVDVMLSEEGGRFYHEQNRNIIIEVTSDKIVKNLPNNYFFLDYYTLNHLVQINNLLNIQLRNLLSLLEF